MDDISLEFKLEYNECTVEDHGLPVIVVAAGSSNRMPGKNKIFLDLLGIPLIARTLLMLERNPYISKIILVTKEEFFNEIQLICDKYMIKKLSDIVKGGDCRQQSVKNGIDRLDKDETAVLIHDGARPFTDYATVKRVAEALNNYNAVCCAVKVKDTIKLVNSNWVVTETLNREHLAAVQTPQGVKVSEYKNAIENISDLSLFTDDMSIMENAGHAVKCVPGSYYNIKVTTEDDIKIAESIILEDDE